jgi:hypothetical protein
MTCHLTAPDGRRASPSISTSPTATGPASVLISVPLVVQNGRIAEQGLHEALLARNGVYARLVQHQFATPAPVPQKHRQVLCGDNRL